MGRAGTAGPTIVSRVNSVFGVRAFGVRHRCVNVTVAVCRVPACSNTIGTDCPAQRLEDVRIRRQRRQRLAGHLEEHVSRLHARLLGGRSWHQPRRLDAGPCEREVGHDPEPRPPRPLRPGRRRRGRLCAWRRDGDGQRLRPVRQIGHGLARDSRHADESGDVDLVGRVARPVVVGVRRREQLHRRNAPGDEARLIGRLEALRRELRLDARDEADAAEHVRPLGGACRSDHAERRRAEPADAVDVEHGADALARTHRMLDVVLRPEHAGLLRRRRDEDDRAS